MNTVKQESQIAVSVRFGDDIYTTSGDVMIGRPDLAISQAPESMSGLAGIWVVSHRESGKVVSLDRRRSMAIREAIIRLEQYSAMARALSGMFSRELAHD